MTNISSKPNSIEPAAPISFLDLPFEVRIKIYESLVPTSSASYHSHTGNLSAHSESGPCLDKDDQARVCPCLLRTNKQIYTEFISLFYGTARFDVKVATKQLDADTKEVTFLNKTYSHTINQPLRMPPNFSLIQKLYLSLDFQNARPVTHPNLLGEDEHYFASTETLEELVKAFSSQENHLRSLEITINQNIRENKQYDMIHDLYKSLKGMRLAMEFNLSPLRKLLVRGKIEIKLETIRLIPMYYCPSWNRTIDRDFGDRWVLEHVACLRWDTVLRSYLDELECYIEKNSKMCLGDSYIFPVAKQVRPQYSLANDWFVPRQM